MQLLILIVKLQGFRVTRETNLWGVPKGLTRGWKTHPEHGSIFQWMEFQKNRYLSLCFLTMDAAGPAASHSYQQKLELTPPCLLCHERWFPQTVKQNKQFPSIRCLCRAFCRSDETSIKNKLVEYTRINGFKGLVTA